MTQIGQLYEKEKIEYANQEKRDALKMLECGYDIVDIMKCTGFTEEELRQIQDEKMTV